MDEILINRLERLKEREKTLALDWEQWNQDADNYLSDHDNISEESINNKS